MYCLEKETVVAFIREVSLELFYLVHLDLKQTGCAQYLV